MNPVRSFKTHMLSAPSLSEVTGSVLERVDEINSHMRKMPTLAEIQTILNKYPCTPDWNKISQYQHQWMFVCDDTLPGHPSHRFLKTSRNFYTAFTKDNFSFWKKRLGNLSYPIAFKEDCKGAPPARIKGQLFLVEPKNFISLDFHRQNTIQFQRERIKVHIPYTYFKYTKTKATMDGFDLLSGNVELRAWMYIGKMDYWRDMSWPPLRDAIVNTTFEPVTTFKPIRQEYLLPYYFWTKLEYDK